MVSLNTFKAAQPESQTVDTGSALGEELHVLEGGLGVREDSGDGGVFLLTQSVIAPKNTACAKGTRVGKRRIPRGRARRARRRWPPPAAGRPRARIPAAVGSVH